jgi:hypothetical protein
MPEVVAEAIARAGPGHDRWMDGAGRHQWLLRPPGAAARRVNHAHPATGFGPVHTRKAQATAIHATVANAEIDDQTGR